MQGQNEVYLTGYLRYPELKETNSGTPWFRGKVAVPFVYTDKKTGEEKEGNNYIKISAWRDVARDLGDLEDGTAVQVVGSFNERSYDGNCKDCGSEQKKYWTDVLVGNFVVVEG